MEWVTKKNIISFSLSNPTLSNFYRNQSESFTRDTPKISFIDFYTDSFIDSSRKSSKDSHWISVTTIHRGFFRVIEKIRLSFYLGNHTRIRPGVATPICHVIFSIHFYVNFFKNLFTVFAKNCSNNPSGISSKSIAKIYRNFSINSSRHPLEVPLQNTLRISPTFHTGIAPAVLPCIIF